MKKKSLPPKFKFYLALLLLGLGFLLLPGAKSPLSSLTSYFLQKGALVRNSFEGLYDYFKSKRLLEEKIRELSEENRRLALKSFLAEERSRESQAAELTLVLSRPPLLPFDSLWVEAGEKDGIKPGFKAVAYEAVLLGEVEEVRAKTSRIKLYSYPEKRLEGYLEEAGLNVLLLGLGGSNFKFSVPKGVLVKIGSQVLSNTQPAYLLGQVEYIKERPNEPLVEVFIRPPLNLKELRYVELKP